MADLTVSANVDTLLQAADFATFRTSLGLTALATTAPGTGVAAALAINVGSAGAPVVLNGAGGTPSSIVLTNATGTANSLTAGVALSAAIGAITGMGSNVATFLATPSSANLRSALTDETGTGGAVFATAPTISDPTITGTATITTVAATTANITTFTVGGFAMTFPGSAATIARTDAGQTFTGASTATSWTFVTPVLGTPTSGTLTNCTADGTNLLGYRGAPQNSQSAAYTLVLADAGKCIFHPVGDNNARAFTIPANGSVAFPVGTIIEFINMAAASCTIPITTDTLTLLPAGTTGTRTLAQYGRASAEKITSTSWVISGNSALT